MDPSLGAGKCLLLLQRLSLWFVVVRGAGSVVASHCDRRRLLLEGCCVFCARQKVTCSSLLSRGLRALQTHSTIAVLFLQLPGHRPPCPKASLLPSCPLPQVWCGLWETASKGTVSALVEWQDSAWGYCILRETAWLLPFYSCWLYENLSSFLCFLNIFVQNPRKSMLFW